MCGINEFERTHLFSYFDLKFSLYNECIYSTLPPDQDVTQGQFLAEVSNQNFPSQTGCLPKLKSLYYYLWP